MSLVSRIEENKQKSYLIVFLFIVLITVIAYFFDRVVGSGYNTLGLALFFSSFSAFGSYYFSSRIILAICRARPLPEKGNENLYRLLERVSRAANLPPPQIYLINDSAPNAFATGRDPAHAVVCLTTGIISKLNEDELEGVVAHELSHIQNYDIRFMALVGVLVGGVTLFSDWFWRSLWFGGRRREESRSGLSPVLVLVGMVFLILSPIFAALIQMAVSRRREFLADASAMVLTHRPLALAAALEKIAADREILEVANRATAPLFIANPLKNRDREASRGWLSLFSTHPPIEERIRILRSL